MLLQFIKKKNNIIKTKEKYNKSENTIKSKMWTRKIKINKKKRKFKFTKMRN